MPFEKLSESGVESKVEADGEKFGKQAEKAMREVIKLFGESQEFFDSDRYEDEKYGVRADGWILLPEWRCGVQCCAPVQFSIRRDIMFGDKGREALQRGSIPYWINPQKIELWIEDKVKYDYIGKELAQDFKRKVWQAADLMKKMGMLKTITSDVILKGRNQRKDAKRHA